MIIRLQVKTPPGHAPKIESQLRPFLLGKLKKPGNTYTSPDDNEFYWELDTDVRGYYRIQRNVNLFHMLAGGTLDRIEKQKKLRKLAKITGETINGARALLNDTQVNIIKTATAQEITEGNKTFWQRIKDKFKKNTI